MSDRSDRSDRSERLRRRFDRPAPGSDGGDADGNGSDGESSAAGTSGGDASSSSSEGARTSVKERPSTLMYLPEEVHRDLDLTFDEVNLKYRRAFDRKLEKNRDYYPLVAVYGLQTLKEWDAAEIDEALEAMR